MPVGLYPYLAVTLPGRQESRRGGCYGARIYSFSFFYYFIIFSKLCSDGVFPSGIKVVAKCRIDTCNSSLLADAGIRPSIDSKARPNAVAEMLTWARIADAFDTWRQLKTHSSSGLARVETSNRALQSARLESGASVWSSGRSATEGLAASPVFLTRAYRKEGPFLQ